MNTLEAFKAKNPLQKKFLGKNELNYIKAGPEDGETIVFIHGSRGTPYAFWRQLADLQETYCCYSLQNPLTDNMEKAAALLQDFLRSEKKDRAHFVGTSVGGYLLQWLAVYQPDCISSLTLSSTLLDRDGVKNPSPFTARVVLPLLPSSSLRKILDKETASYPEKYRELASFIDREITATLSSRELAIRARTLNRNGTVPEFSTDDFKITIIEAEDDDVVPLQARNRVAERYPQAKRHILADGGHFPYLHRPEEYNNILKVFFTRIPQK